MEEIKSEDKPKPKVDIKSNWLKTDKRCEACGQVTERAKGLTKENVKRLFSFNYKNSQEWIWTLVIIGICFLAWSYKTDMAAYNEVVQNPNEFCMKYMQMKSGISLQGANSNIDMGKLNGIEGLEIINQTTTPWNPTV